jgi:hypothetical protein
MPIVLFGSDYWSGLIDWMKKTLSPHFIDEEDLDIFRLADTPQEAVRQVKLGVKKPWWRPLDKELAESLESGKSKTPISGGKALNTGEGTRYGIRPKRSEKKHISARRKPEQ